MFVELNRVYFDTKTNTKKSQKITVALEAIESVRPSNRLGRDVPEHRSTITLISGATIDLSNLYSEVVALLND